MNVVLEKLLERIVALPPQQRELVVPVLALAFELYVPGLLLPAGLRQQVVRLLASLALEEESGYEAARLALEQRYRSVGLTAEVMRSLLPPAKVIALRAGSRTRAPSRVSSIAKL